MTTSTCGQCAQWTRTLPGRRKEDEHMERVCVKGNRPVCQSMLADPACFERRADRLSQQSGKEHDFCGECDQWPRTTPGRRREDGEMSRVCLKGGRLVYRDMRADPFCFARRVDLVQA